MKTPIIITGIRGFIGSAIASRLRADGYPVYGIDIADAPDDPAIRRVNLLNAVETRAAFLRFPAPYTVIHLAALAHNQQPPAGETCFSINTTMTRHLLDAVRDSAARFILFSSVAVYGEAGRRYPVSLRDPLAPASEYGRSKAACEAMVGASGLPADILRLAPVYDATHRKDLFKRLTIAERLPIRIVPPPSYSLCEVSVVVETMAALLGEERIGQLLHHITDPAPHRQDALLHAYRPGFALPIYPQLLQPFLLLAKGLLSSEKEYSLRSAMHKLLCDTTYLAGERCPYPPKTVSAQESAALHMT